MDLQAVGVLLAVVALGIILTGLAMREEATGDVALTEAGRTEALRVVRGHRLWEHWLAERTGVAAPEWHAQAEAREHELTASAVEALAERLGRPIYDPHGDPIPQADGSLPPRRGLPLSGLPPGGRGRVTHVEDEPRAVFEAVLKAGVAAGALLEVLARTGEGGVRVRVAGRESELGATAAAAVAIEPLDGIDGEAIASDAVEPLTAIRPPDRARVVRLAAACRGPQRRRLLDLGFVPGTDVAAELASASGDPVAYRVRGALVALRSAQAERVLVRRMREPGA